MNNDIKPKFTAPTKADIERLAKQWLFVDGLVSERYAAALDQSMNDLEFIQRLLDDNVFERGETWELQSLGVVFGRVLLYNNSGLDWWIIDDEYGRDPTIRYEQTSLHINVLTIISKRVEAGEVVNVVQAYDSIVNMIDDLKNEIH